MSKKQNTKKKHKKDFKKSDYFPSYSTKKKHSFTYTSSKDIESIAYQVFGSLYYSPELD